jgi:hypothetical protein
MDLYSIFINIQESDLDLSWMKSKDEQGKYRLYKHKVSPVDEPSATITKNPTGSGYFTFSGNTYKTLKEAKQEAFSDVVMRSYTALEEMQSRFEVKGTLNGYNIHALHMGVLEHALGKYVGHYLNVKLTQARAKGFQVLPESNRLGSSLAAVSDNQSMFTFYNVRIMQAFIRNGLRQITGQDITLTVSSDTYNKKGEYWESTPTFGDSGSKEIALAGLKHADLMAACDEMIKVSVGKLD